MKLRSAGTPEKLLAANRTDQAFLPRYTFQDEERASHAMESFMVRSTLDEGTLVKAKVLPHLSEHMVIFSLAEYYPHGGGFRRDKPCKIDPNGCAWCEKVGSIFANRKNSLPCSIRYKA